MDAAETEAALALSRDSTKLAAYAIRGCTDGELGDLFGVPADVLAAYGALLKKSRATYRARMRQTLLDQADRGAPEALHYIITELTGEE